MKKDLSVWPNIYDFYFSPTSFLISIFLIIISYLYLNRKVICYKLNKRKIDKLFSLDRALEKEINNFRAQQTKLIFHFIHIFPDSKTYKKIYLPSQNIFLDIKGKDLTIDFTDKKYPYKYNISEKFILFNDIDDKKTFLIIINKNVENHYNIIIDKTQDKKTFSLEIIVYSKIKKCLHEINKLENLKLYQKENYDPNILRFNIINAREEELLYIYSINMEEEKKSKIERNIFSEYKENLLLNIIYSKDEKIVFRRIFENTEENIILTFTKDEIYLIKDLYVKVIKKYLDVDSDIASNIEDFKNEFISYDKAHGYSSELDKVTNEVIIDSDLRRIDLKFKCTPFYLRNYEKEDLLLEELKLTEYLCYLNLLLIEDDYFIDRIQDFIKNKNLIFDKYFTLTNKDKSLILINLLTNEKNNKSNYTFRSFYDLPDKSPYVQSELFFRKTISQLSNNSSLSFLYLQLNSGSGEDYLTKTEHYKIRMIPLIEIKYHLLQKFFYTYFFTFDSNNKIMAFNNVNTQILSFNESADIGYSKPKGISKYAIKNSNNNTIKLSFLKFHEQAHIKFRGNYDDKLDPRYLLNDDLQLIDNKIINRNDNNNDNDELSVSGESGNALEYFIFNDFLTLDKLMKSKKDLSILNNINLLIQDNFDELRRYSQQLTKNVRLINTYDKQNELYKKYKEKIKKSNKLKNKKLSEIRLSDLEIEELY